MENNTPRGTHRARRNSGRANNTHTHKHRIQSSSNSGRPSNSRSWAFARASRAHPSPGRVSARKHRALRNSPMSLTHFRWTISSSIYQRTCLRFSHTTRVMYACSFLTSAVIAIAESVIAHEASIPSIPSLSSLRACPLPWRLTQPASL